MRWHDLKLVSISRLEERRGWLGQQQADPGQDPPVGAWTGPEHEPKEPVR
jgi:hypothetical protein